MISVLVIDDERSIREGLRRTLEAEGYSVRAVRSGDAAVAAIAACTPDVVLLDVMMPGENGFHVCERIRATDPELPIIFLTALSSEVDQVRAFSCGGDDFISKTAGVPRILASIERAVARTSQRGLADAEVRIGATRVDFGKYTLLRGGETIELTQSECGILALLCAHRGSFLSKDDVIRGLRGQGFACEDGFVYVYMNRLRKKLGPDGSRLVSARLIGYKLLD